MNVSSLIRLPFVAASGGGGGSSPVIYRSDTMEADRVELTVGTHPIAAGAYCVKIKNAGIYPIVVNGDSISSGGEYVFESFVDEVNRTQFFTPAISIVIPQGGEAWYVEHRPS